MDLAIDAAGGTVSLNEKGRVVVLSRRTRLPLIAAQKYRHASLLDQGSNDVGGWAIFVKEERRGRFRPEHQIGTPADGLPGHAQVCLKDRRGAAGHPFLALLHVPLYDPDFQ